MGKTKISVLLPVYNEKENLVPLLDELELVLQSLGKPFEVIAVDDGSSDGSAELLTEVVRSRPYLRVILFRTNTGQTAALDAGFRHATGDIIATMDADRQNDPRDLVGMVAKLEEGYDCVAGFRRNRQDGFWLRRLPSMMANRIIRLMWKSELKDLGCAIKAYRKEITDELRLYGEMHRFIGILLEGLGARVATYEVNHRPRTAGKSKYNLSRVFKVILDLVTIWFLQGFRTKPIHVFGGLGGLCMGLSGFVSLIGLWQKFYYQFSLNRNPLFFLGIFLAGLAVQFIFLGLIAELIIRNYFESTNHSPYSIRARLGFVPSGEEKRVA